MLVNIVNSDWYPSDRNQLLYWPQIIAPPYNALAIFIEHGTMVKT